MLAAVIFGAPGALPHAEAQAQEPEASVTVTQLEASEYPQMQAVVTVVGADGVPVQGLTAADFTALDDAGGVEIASVEQVQNTTLRLAVLLVIDVSGSMQGPPLEAAKQAASAYVDQLGPNDEAAVLAFNEQLRTVVDLTSDRAALRAGIESLAAVGGTSLYEAVQVSLFVAGASNAPRRAVVLLSDGVNDSALSQVTEAQSLDAARASRVPAFAIAFGSGADTAYLQELANQTQGQYFPADAADIGAVYGAIAELLRSQYVLTLRAAAPADGGDATLRIAANVAGAPVTSAPVSFVRGDAPAAVPTSTPAPVVAPAEPDGGGSPTLALILLGLLTAGVLGGGGAVATGRVRESRRQRAREEGAGQQSFEPLPEKAAMGGSVEKAERIRGRIVAIGGPDAGRAYQFGEKPLVIGSDAAADVRLERSTAVAPKHAQVWVRDGKIMLRHMGGTRLTLVQGRQVEWVILEEGDEFFIGPHAYRAEVAGRNGLEPA